MGTRNAVYIGGPAFGARHHADNPVSEIAGLVEYAHRFHARIYVTLNTILHDDELEPARRLIQDLYDAGVDALIVQDLGFWSWTSRPSICMPPPSATSVPRRRHASWPRWASPRSSWPAN